MCVCGGGGGGGMAFNSQMITMDGIKARLWKMPQLGVDECQLLIHGRSGYTHVMVVYVWMMS